MKYYKFHHENCIIYAFSTIGEVYDEIIPGKIHPQFQTELSMKSILDSCKYSSAWIEITKEQFENIQMEYL